MDILPDDIFLKIMMFNTHPIADILKASTIFKFLQLRENYLKHRQFGCEFSHGRCAGYLHGSSSIQIFLGYKDGLTQPIDETMIKQKNRR